MSRNLSGVLRQGLRSRRFGTIGSSGRASGPGNIEALVGAITLQGLQVMPTTRLFTPFLCRLR
jgi:hypothetical protein